MPKAGIRRVTQEPQKKTAGIKVTQLGDFRLKRRLGKGGMGEVFLAQQVSLDRPVALKTLTKELAQNEEFVARFQREARSMAKIDHVNVVKVYAVDAARGIHFVAIEYIDGKSVQDWLDKLEKFPVADAAHIAVVCAEALWHAHEENMVHRDIKPDNVLLTSKGVVKVADFGLAKVMDEDVSMTQSSTGLGTPLYMAPEQARSAKHVDQRCDIYALGATLYHMLTGQLPFSGGSTLELIIAKERGTYTSARQLCQEIPERLDLIIDKMMAKDPAHRYKDCGEVLRDLSALGMHGRAISFIEGAQPPSILGRSQAPTVAGIGNTIVANTALLTASQTGAGVSSRVSRTWYVQYRTSDSKNAMEKLSTRRVVKMINAGMLTAKARAKASADGSYLPLVQFPEFSDAIELQLLRRAATGKVEDMQSLYKQVERAEIKRLRWRWVKDKLRGIVNSIGLLVWIIAILLTGVTLWVGGQWVFHRLGEEYEKMVEPTEEQKQDPLAPSALRGSQNGS